VFSFYYNINDFKQIHAAIRRKWSGTASLQVLLAFHPFYNFNFNTISISNYKLQCIKILKSLLGKVRHLVVVHLVPE